MKRKLKLKRWVKSTLIAIAAIGVLVLSAITLDKHYNNAVEECVAGGNTRVFCENTLR